MRILGYEEKVRIEYVRGKNHFFELLGGARESYLHICAHGEKKSEGTVIVTPRGAEINANDLEGLWEKKRRKPQLVVLSACNAGRIDLVRALSDAGCRYVIAFLNENYWVDAALFVCIFYKLLIGDGKSSQASYKNAVLGFKTAFGKLSGAWRFYEDGGLSI